MCPYTDNMRPIPSRRGVLALSVALMILVAGCSSGASNSDPDPETPADTVTPTRERTTQETTSRGENHTGPVSLENASREKKRAVNDSLRSFYGGLTAMESRPDEVAATAAQRSCSTLPKINRSFLTSPGETQERARVLSHAAGVLNSNYDNVHVSPAKLRTVADGAGTLAKYTTLIGPWNAYREASCAFDRDKPETVEDYYIATGALVFELAMMQNQVYYKTGFKAVNVASHNRAYRRIQTEFGDEVFGLSMSVSHWAARGSLESAFAFVREKAIAMNVSVDDSASNVSRLTNQFAPSLGSEWEQAMGESSNVTELVETCYDEVDAEGSESGGWLDEAGDAFDSVKDAGESVVSGDYNVSDAIGDAEGINRSQVSDETLSRIKGCVREKSGGEK